MNAVQMFDADGDGKKEAVAEGVRHGVEQAVIVAFDPGRVSGANAMPEGHPRAIVDMGPSSEKSTGFLARSQLSKELGPFNLKTAVHPSQPRPAPMFTPPRAVLGNHPLGEVRSSCAAQ